ncbi:hypothetical protein V0M98_32720 (plasmid) [Pseudomonas silesiensis]|uniref:hypothetical protein n=1 Tax=Pseudomonas silesiensis TaxID=1853130 RepID=UPI0030D4FC1B
MPDSNVTFDHITAGFIMSELVAWELKLDDEHPASSDEFTRDWLMGALWLLSEAISNAVSNSGMQWDHGVFAYEHCENNSSSVWLPVADRMSAEEWSDLAGNNELPEWLTEQVTETMKALGLLTGNGGE